MSLALVPPAGTRSRGVSRRAPGEVVVPLDRYREVSRHPAGRALPRPAAEPAAEPAAAPGPAPLRLTARGRRLVRALVLLAVAAVVAAGVLTSRTALGGTEDAPAPARQVVVLPGDTLWSIAGEVAPSADRRETVARIVRLNDLQGSSVTAGQQLLVPAP